MFAFKQNKFNNMNTLLVTISSLNISNISYFIYAIEEAPRTINNQEVEQLQRILQRYPNVFTKLEIRGLEEPILSDQRTEVQDFDFENIFDECKGLEELLNESFNFSFFGINAKEVRDIIG